MIEVMEFVSVSVVDSTNSYLRKFAPELRSGTVVSAELQTAGRGRGENRWFCPRGGGALFSILLDKPSDLGIEFSSHISLDVAETIAGWLRRRYEVAAEIKAPNDVLVGGRKICGVLVEESSGKLIVGVGLNTNLDPCSLGRDFAATSLRKLVGGEFDNTAIVQDLSAEIIRSLRDLL
jgi:BirA family biotin operon repressor/biotin-[acetyl-CoA-carboxylase] ligase